MATGSESILTGISIIIFKIGQRIKAELLREFCLIHSLLIYINAFHC
ncbi:hypothetical protein QWZ13_01605 [Reinekea marina]|nr:hypothetical protein [Reinekea marina]MDN3647600.1 hypothetical protein [Reinekea marina]